MNTPPESEILLQLAGLQGKLIKRVDGAFMVHGISFTEFIVMYHLNQAAPEPMRRIDLAEKVGLSASGITRLLNPMQKVGLVKKEESARDARVSLVALTKAGKEVFNDANTSFKRCAETLLQPLNEKEQASFARHILKLL